MIHLVFVVVVVVLIAGFICWAIGKLPLIDEPFKRIAQGVILLALLLWLIVCLYDVCTGKAAPVPKVFL